MPLADLNLPFQTASAYAYSPRERGGNNKFHIMTLEDISIGRLTRRKGQALCKTNFWGLDKCTQEEITCPKCLEIAERLGSK